MNLVLWLILIVAAKGLKPRLSEDFPLLSSLFLAQLLFGTFIGTVIKKEVKEIKRETGSIWSDRLQALFLMCLASFNGNFLGQILGGLLKYENVRSLLYLGTQATTSFGGPGSAALLLRGTAYNKLKERICIFATLIVAAWLISSFIIYSYLDYIPWISLEENIKLLLPFGGVAISIIAFYVAGGSDLTGKLIFSHLGGNRISEFLWNLFEQRFSKDSISSFVEVLMSQMVPVGIILAGILRIHIELM